LIQLPSPGYNFGSGVDPKIIPHPHRKTDYAAGEEATTALKETANGTSILVLIVEPAVAS